LLLTPDTSVSSRVSGRNRVRGSGQIFVNLPVRVRDVLLRPYVWQVGNVSQQLGVLGSLVTLAVLLLLITSIAREPKAAFARAGPLLYIAAALLVAYSLSSGNAGTAFRYRTHVVTFAIAALAATRVPQRQEHPETQRPLTAATVHFDPA
jgi:hypothetical protein